MNEQHDSISQMRAITVAHAYGSGGGEIAARLAARLGWRLIDHEIVIRVAQEMGISEKAAEARDERAEGVVTSILKNVQSMHPVLFAPSPMPLADEHVYHEALSKVVEGAATAGHVVIVGRGSQALLAHRRDVFHVRIVAPLDHRVAYVMQREGLDRAAAHARIQLKDHDRTRYLQWQHHQHPDNPLLYDLVVNTNVIDLDGVVDIIQLALQRKAARLSVPTGQLGPGAGLPRYPGRPGDLRPPESMTEEHKH